MFNATGSLILSSYLRTGLPADLRISHSPCFLHSRPAHHDPNNITSVPWYVLHVYLGFYLHESDSSALQSSPTGKYGIMPQFFSLGTWQNKMAAASGLEVVR